MSYSSGAPDVYNYGQYRPTSGGFDNAPYGNNYGYAPATPYTNGAVNSYGESQVNRVYAPVQPANVNTTQPALNVQTTTQQVVNNNQANTITYGNQPNQSGSVGQYQTDDRYNNYGTTADNYKYNLFSSVDEPWNSCQDGRKCGKFPGNECIAS